MQRCQQSRGAWIVAVDQPVHRIGEADAEARPAAMHTAAGTPVSEAIGGWSILHRLGLQAESRREPPRLVVEDVPAP